MKVIENRNAKRIIERIIPKEILAKQPVIAGGFILALYMKVIHFSNPARDIELEEKISSIFKSSTIYTLKRDINDDLGIKFGDIDFWFLEDNEIWEEETDYRFSLIRGFRNKDSLSGGYIRQALGNFGLLREDKSSLWATTYTADNYFDFQMIKKTFASIQELFDNFDILNCCAAYYDGEFYFEDNVFEAMNNRELVPGNLFPKQDIVSRLWSASRVFKYARRYALEFSKELCEEIVEIFVEIENLEKEMASLSDTDSVNIAGAILSGTKESEALRLIIAAYGASESLNKKGLTLLIQKMRENFPSLLSMKNFKEDTIFYFLNTSDAEMLKVINGYMEVMEQVKNNEIIHCKEVDFSGEQDFQGVYINRRF